MSLLRAVIATCCLGLATSVLGQDGHPFGRVENLSVTNGQVTAELVNTSDSAWTAWVVELRRSGDPRSAPRFRQTTDVYASTAMAESDSTNDALIRPGERRQILLAPASGTDHDLPPSVHLLAVVRADQSASGDEAIVNEIFDARSYELSDAQSVLSEIRASPATPAETLKRVRAKANLLANARGKSRASQFPRGLTSELARHINQTVDAGMDANAALTAFTLVLEKRLKAAQTHSTRREAK